MPDKPKKAKINVKDKRGSRSPDAASTEGDWGSSPEASAATDDEKHDYLVDLQRLQAEFENYRKRMMKEQAGISERAKARLIENLLPVLDDFERAISHGEGGEGVALVFRQIKGVLEAEGLAEVPGEGASFDPNVHEAVESREVPDSDEYEPKVHTVYRRGYKLGDQLLRPAMVVVARPPDADTELQDDAEEVAEG